MSNGNRQNRPGSMQDVGPKAAEETAFVPHGTDRDRSWPLTDPMRAVRHERQQAAAQIQSSLKAWRKQSGAAGRGQAAVPQSGGAPLADGVRAKMEPQLGADLSGVKVHTSGESAQAATQFGARAFTTGSDVHFGAGEYAPGTKEGDRLIAHELTHAVQAQRSGVQRKAEAGQDEGAEDARQEVSHPADPAEKEADAVADEAAEQLHGDGAKQPAGKGEGGKERAPTIGLKPQPDVIFRMPKVREGHEDRNEGRGEKGKSFRGGKKKDRDNWYGFDDPEFQNWWHRIGKQEFGQGKDIDNRQQAQAAYNYWVQQGKPRGGK